MYFFSDQLINHARAIYKNLKITGYESGDAFFATFGPGNMIYFLDKPYERFSDYEALLSLLQQDDPIKYEAIHKGTPFYYLSWTAFDLRNYEKALFYIDAAISEDIRIAPKDWLDKPGAAFLTLKKPEIQVARRNIENTRELLQKELNRFNSISNQSPFDIESFVNRFVRVLVLEQDVTRRTIVSAFYVFLLEFYDRYSELLLRSNRGGSIQPFIIHLFKGGLVFESLLKHLYPTMDNGKPPKTLSDIFKTTSFQNDFNVTVQTSSDTLQDIINGIQGNSMESAFTTTSKLRNTTGHNLVWDDIFNNPYHYEALFIQEMNAMLYIISVKFP